MTPEERTVARTKSNAKIDFVCDWFLLALCIAVLCWIASCIYIAVHFIAKYW